MRPDPVPPAAALLLGGLGVLRLGVALDGGGAVLAVQLLVLVAGGAVVAGSVHALALGLSGARPRWRLPRPLVAAAVSLLLLGAACLATASRAREVATEAGPCPPAFSRPVATTPACERADDVRERELLAVGAVGAASTALVAVLLWRRAEP